jgi:DNA-binding Xre family transcriptional regulator
MNINEFISAYIDSKGVKRTTIAKSLGITKQNLNRILNAPDLKVSQLLEICKVLDVDPGFFLSETNSKKNSEIEKYKGKIEALEYAIGSHYRALADKYYHAVSNILQTEYKHIDPKIKERILNRVSVFDGDLQLDNLILSISEGSMVEIKKNVAGMIRDIEAGVIWGL